MRYHFKNLLLVLCLLLSVGAYAQTASHQWRSIHKVKKSETVFGIAKEYGVTLEQLLDANPEMKQPGYELRKGDWVFVPYKHRGDKDADDKKVGREMLVEQQARPVLHNVIKVGVMLPIHLENSEGERMVEYLQGVRLALDSLARRSVNAEVMVWNLAKDSSVVKVLADPRAYTLDVIFGPLYSEQLPPLSKFCRDNGIKLFVPFSIDGNEVATNPQLMQVYQPADTLRAKSVKAFVERFQRTHHPVLIDCNNPTDGKVAFTTALRTTLTAKGSKVSLTNVNTPLEQFAKQFSRKKPNVVVLNTAKSPELNRVFAKLDSLTHQYPGLAISVFGYNEWFMYQKYDLANFYKYNVYIPTTYYYNIGSRATEALEHDFETRWGVPMMTQWLPRMGLLGYDHTLFVVLGLHNHGKDFVGSEEQSDYRSLQTPLKFKRVSPQGGYRNATFQLIHFRTDQRLESVSY